MELYRNGGRSIIQEFAGSSMNGLIHEMQKLSPQLGQYQALLRSKQKDVQEVRAKDASDIDAISKRLVASHEGLLNGLQTMLDQVQGVAEA